MDGVWKAYQVLAQVILRDFKLIIKKQKPLPGNNFPRFKQGKLLPFHSDPLPNFLQSKKQKA